MKSSNVPLDVQYMLIGEVSDLTRTPVATLYQWKSRGDGPPAHKVGRKLLYRRDQVVAWIESQATGRTPAA